MKKIAVIEDDRDLCRVLCALLKNNGYLPWTPDDFDDLAGKLLGRRPDLILLDINIPGRKDNGRKTLRRIRRKSDVPVIMVTGRNTASDEAGCISIGADDYVTKPYNPTILLRRIAAVIRRSDKSPGVVTYRDLVIDLNKGIVKKDKKEEWLTKNEMIILSALLRGRQGIVTRDRLMRDLWDNEEYVNDNALTVNVSRLRAKLASLSDSEYIETRKGIGYILL